MSAMRSAHRIIILAALGAAAASCGDVVRQGRAPVLLVVNSLQGARGSAPATFGVPLSSDVITNVITPAPCSAATPCPTVFNDIGQAVFQVTMKDVSVSPSANNQVTITQYHVEYPHRRTQCRGRRRTVFIRRRGDADDCRRRHRHPAIRDRPLHGQTRSAVGSAEDEPDRNLHAGTGDLLRRRRGRQRHPGDGFAQRQLCEFWGPMRTRFYRLAGIACVVLATACGVHQTEAPSLSGPSTLAQYR